MKKVEMYECGLFYCNRRRSRACCYHCGYKRSCKNSCQNHPDKCGNYCEKTAGSEEHISQKCVDIAELLEPLELAVLDIALRSCDMEKLPEKKQDVLGDLRAVMAAARRYKKRREE